MSPSIKLLVSSLVFLLCCGPNHHPEGYARGEVHGGALTRGAEDCRTCHGGDLRGGSAEVSCDGCHRGSSPTAWRQRCTFCHGGIEDDTGAPPRNLDGTTTGGAFTAHPIHVEGGGLAAPIPCDACHVRPDDVLSPGHVFDATRGEAEVRFASGGKNPSGRYADGRCTNLYCHGTGRGSDGQAVDGMGPLGCTSCHGGVDNGERGLSASHLRSHAGIACAQCHAGRVGVDGITIPDPARHVDGVVDIAFAVPGFTWTAATRTCRGACHGEVHGSRTWVR
jgi:predicted CxxxxCH...CXXCH cytochrome family protein